MLSNSYDKSLIQAPIQALFRLLFRLLSKLLCRAKDKPADYFRPKRSLLFQL